MLESANPSWKKHGLWVIVAALALVGAGSAFYGSSGRHREIVTVRRGDIVHSYVAQGRVECGVMIDVFPEITARIKNVTVRENDEIEPGQSLVLLEDDVLRAAHMEAVHAAKASEAKWEELKQGTRPEDLDQARAQVAELQAELKRATARFNEVNGQARPEDIAIAKNLLKAAQTDEANAAKELERLKMSRGVTSDTDMDVGGLRLTMAASTRSTREEELKKLEAGATDNEREQAEAAKMAAQGRLERAQAQLELLKAGASKEELRAAEAMYQQAAAAERRAAAMLDNTEIKSPIEGVVLRRYHDEQELVHPQMPDPILVICDRKPREMRVEVVEGDVYKMRVGQSAWITSEGFIGQQWRGKVKRVALVMGRKHLSSENPKERFDVKILEAWVTPDEPLDLPVNLPVEIMVSETVRSDVAVMPVRAVIEGDQVMLADGSRRQVVLGPRDDGFVEIVSGLEIGERVLLP